MNTPSPFIHPIDALSLWNRVTIRCMRELPHDLTTRQLAIIFSIYLTPPPHTVRSLAAHLGISKPAICRALDSLSTLDFIKRKKDEKDKRNVFIQRTIIGSVFLRDVADIISQEMNENKSPSIAEVA